MRTPYEKEVQAECLNWLNSQSNIWAWRRTIGKFKVGSRFISVNQVGQSDVEGIIKIKPSLAPSLEMLHRNPGWTGELGIHLEIETKRIGNKPTKEQAAWSMAVNATGAIGLWCDSLDMLKAKLKRELYYRGWR